MISQNLEYIVYSTIRLYKLGIISIDKVVMLILKIAGIYNYLS